MKDTSIVGDLINFRGLVYSPVNENGVIFVFGKVIEDLNMYIEEIKPGFPDCIGRRFTGRGWEKVHIEFEYKSGNFLEHGHNAKDCDLIVCWEHDWPECPLEVIELRNEIKNFPNKPIERPDVQRPEYTIEDLWRKRKVSDSTRNLFKTFDREVRKIDDEIWKKVAKTTTTYYSPERVFCYTYFRKRAIDFVLFTKGEKINGVKNYRDTSQKAGDKWGEIQLHDEKDLPRIIEAAQTSYRFVKEAIANNETTGWYAKIVEEDSDEVI